MLPTAHPHWVRALVERKEAAGVAGEDRTLALRLSEGWLLAVADGVGGRSNGALAAELAVAWLKRHAEEVVSGGWGWDAALATLDQHVEGAAEGGETTLVVAMVSGGEVSGASVGDSAGWLVSAADTLELTDRQRAKPRLGSWSARPVAFRQAIPATPCRLLLATDGVWKYQVYASLIERARLVRLEAAADALLQAARLPSGALQDDASLVLAELERPVLKAAP